MVTKRELAAQAERLAAEQAEKKRRSEESQAAWLAGLDAANQERARSLVAEELSQALLRWNATGLRGVRLDQTRVFRAAGGEVYGDQFRLGFCPAPDYGPTKTLLTSLRRAGFAARAVTEDEQNVEFQNFSDGMGPVTVPGTHPAHYLVIDWS